MNPLIQQKLLQMKFIDWLPDGEKLEDLKEFELDMHDAHVKLIALILRDQTDIKSFLKTELRIADAIKKMNKFENSDKVVEDIKECMDENKASKILSMFNLSDDKKD